MKIRHVPMIAALALAVQLPATAQTEPAPPPAENITDTAIRNPFWQVSLNTGGRYKVRLDRIATISRHQYLLDGAIIVDEITIDTAGRALARFYNLKPATEAVANDSVARLTGRAQEIVGQAAARVGTNLHDMVVKKYPDTTHAGMIEFRIETTQQLDALYKSLDEAWTTGRGREISVTK